MSQTMNDINSAALVKAAQLLGTKTERDTVNRALIEVARRRMLERYAAKIRDRGHEELEALRVSAWRSADESVSAH